MTKESILNKSLELFNNKGSKETSTNEIGEILGIKPGVFYKHFEDKNDIILKLFYQMTQEWKEDDYQINSVVLTDEILKKLLEKVGSFFRKYRFIFKEYVFLIESDTRIKRLNYKVQAKRLTEVKQMVEINIKEGILRELEDSEKNFFITTLWMSSMFWKPYEKVIGQSYEEKSEKEILSHLRLLFKLFKA